MARSRVGAIAGAVVLGCAAACGPTYGSNAPATADGAVTALVTAAGGGVLESPSGAVFAIPPGALAKDTQITMAPMSQGDLDPSWGAAVRFEPSGLVFAKPAMLTLPLARPAYADNPPVVLEFDGSDAANAIETGLLASISADGSTATIPVNHFSGDICANNCHAGTLEFLLKSFTSRGVSDGDVRACVQAKFPRAPLPTSCDWATRDGIQPLLDTAFDEILEFPDGTDVDRATLDRIAAWAARGQNVVFAFNKGAPRPRGGPFGFHDDIAHTAVVEMHDGEWQIRNAVVAGAEVRRALGGTNLVWWPLQDLNTFRAMRSAEAAERQVCGTPGCLTGKDNLPPLDLRNRDGHPWGGLRVYVERDGAIAGCVGAGGARPIADPCGASGTWLSTCTRQGSCTACAGAALTETAPFTVPPMAAAFGGTWTDGPRTYTFDVATCTLTQTVVKQNACISGMLSFSRVLKGGSGFETIFYCADSETATCRCTEPAFCSDARP